MRENRISRDELYLEMCKLISRRATCERAQVGCVIILGKSISTGYNGPKSYEPHCTSELCDISKSCTRAQHAEINAINNATFSIWGATLYCNYSPCIDCANLIERSGIKRVVFREFFRDKSGIELLREANIEVCQIG